MTTEHRYQVRGTAEPKRHHAVCDCGWQGRSTPYHSAATEDGKDHVNEAKRLEAAR